MPLTDVHGVTLQVDQDDESSARRLSYRLVLITAAGPMPVSSRREFDREACERLATRIRALAGLPVVGHIDRVMFGLQPTLDKTGDFLFVFDDQDVHKGSRELGIDRSFPLRLVARDPFAVLRFQGLNIPDIGFAWHATAADGYFNSTAVVKDSLTLVLVERGKSNKVDP